MNRNWNGGYASFELVNKPYKVHMCRFIKTHNLWTHPTTLLTFAVGVGAFLQGLAEEATNLLLCYDPNIVTVTLWGRWPGLHKVMRSL